LPGREAALHDAWPAAGISFEFVFEISGFAETAASSKIAGRSITLRKRGVFAT
jgi:hypothetical protein